MRPIIRALGLMAVLFCLSGCTAGVLAGSAWVATEAYADKTPFDYMAEFFERDCEAMTPYDQPPRCRR